MASYAKPPADIQVDAALVAALIAEQHPDLAGLLELREVDSGWDNWMFRLGEDMAVRLPRRALAVELIETERRWLPRLAERISLPIPTPLYFGRPSPRFARPWTIVAWIAGSSAETIPLAADQAGVLGRFMAELHQPAPADAPRNDYRGIALATRRADVEGRLAELRARAPALDHAGLAAVWAEALAAPLDLAPTWLHGDLHPRNLIAGPKGALSGVVDWGDLCAGDPACDLAAAWMHFDPGDQGPLWRARGPLSAATLARARGWAVLFGSILLLSGLEGDLAFARAGRRTLERVVMG